jgi:hypothetical protein
MNAPCQTRFPGQIDELLVKEPSSRKLRKLHEHLAACPSCQHRYNKVILATRLFEGGPKALTVPSEGELRRVGDEVMRRVRLLPDPAQAQPARRQVVSWVAAIATCGVVLAIALPLVLHKAGRPPTTSGPAGISENAGGGSAGGVEEHDFQPRGGSGAGPAVVGVMGFRAFCISKLAGLAPQVTGLQPDGACRTSDVLKFAYTNRARKPLPYLFLVGVDEKHRIKWYEPHPPARHSVAIKSDIADEPIERAVRLAVNHQAGQLRIFALFSQKPIEADAIERTVAELAKRGTSIAKLAELPGQPADCLQQSLLIKLEP